MLYAILSADNAAIQSYQEFPAAADPTTIRRKWNGVPVTEIKPAFDAAQQKLVVAAQTIDSDGRGVTITYVAVPLAPVELLARPGRPVNKRTIAGVVGVQKTAALLDALDNLAKTGLTVGQTSYAGSVFRLVRDLLDNLGTFDEPGGIDMTTAESQMFLALLAAQGLITEQDVAAIMAVAASPAG